jgi:hypothetical protein
LLNEVPVELFDVHPAMMRQRHRGRE